MARFPNKFSDQEKLAWMSLIETDAKLPHELAEFVAMFKMGRNGIKNYFNTKKALPAGKSWRFSWKNEHPGVAVAEDGSTNSVSYF